MKSSNGLWLRKVAQLKSLNIIVHSGMGIVEAIFDARSYYLPAEGVPLHLNDKNWNLKLAGTEMIWQSQAVVLDRVPANAIVSANLIVPKNWKHAPKQTLRDLRVARAQAEIQPTNPCEEGHSTMFGIALAQQHDNGCNFIETDKFRKPDSWNTTASS